MLDRVMRILNCFTVNEPELRLSELVEKTGLHKSTVYRLLAAMRGYRLAGMDEDSGKFHLGLKFFELGMLAMRRLGVEEHAHPILERLVEQTGHDNAGRRHRRETRSAVGAQAQAPPRIGS